MLHRIKRWKNIHTKVEDIHQFLSIKWCLRKRMLKCNQTLLLLDQGMFGWNEYRKPVTNMYLFFRLTHFQFFTDNRYKFVSWIHTWRIFKDYLSIYTPYSRDILISMTTLLSVKEDNKHLLLLVFSLVIVPRILIINRTVNFNEEINFCLSSL